MSGCRETATCAYAAGHPGEHYFPLPEATMNDGLVGDLRRVSGRNLEITKQLGTLAARVLEANRLIHEILVITKSKEDLERPGLRLARIEALIEAYHAEG